MFIKLSLFVVLLVAVEAQQKKCNMADIKISTNGACTSKKGQQVDSGSQVTCTCNKGFAGVAHFTDVFDDEWDDYSGEFDGYDGSDMGGGYDGPGSYGNGNSGNFGNYGGRNIGNGGSYGNYGTQNSRYSGNGGNYGNYPGRNNNGFNGGNQYRGKRATSGRYNGGGSNGYNSGRYNDDSYEYDYNGQGDGGSYEDDYSGEDYMDMEREIFTTMPLEVWCDEFNGNASWSHTNITCVPEAQIANMTGYRRNATESCDLSVVQIKANGKCMPSYGDKTRTNILDMDMINCTCDKGYYGVARGNPIDEPMEYAPMYFNDTNQLEMSCIFAMDVGNWEYFRPQCLRLPIAPLKCPQDIPIIENGECWRYDQEMECECEYGFRLTGNPRSINCNQSTKTWAGLPKCVASRRRPSNNWWNKRR